MTNKIDNVTMATGGQNNHFSDDHKSIKVDNPGFAKASPLFKQIEAEEVPSEEEKNKALAEKTKIVK